MQIWVEFVWVDGILAWWKIFAIRRDVEFGLTLEEGKSALGQAG